jgi:FMN phosphatase YigB (HAD superfamily)
VITTLLFDLDDTLLGNDLDTFLRAYFQKLAAEFADLPGGDRVGQETVNATRAMFGNADPARVLLDVFSDCFSEATGWAPKTWRPRFDRFNANGYRSLQALTTPRPAARAILDWALAHNYAVAIATNPVFSLPALRERLRWAGVDDYPFAHISSIETSHFTKPHPEYYAEILGRLGRRPDQALMVGNDWRNDIEPAARLGLSTYRITYGNGAQDESALASPLGHGTLEDFLAFAAGGLPEAPPAPGPALAYVLAGNLSALLAEIQGWPADLWTRRPAAGEWSLTELVCHLRDVEREVNIPRLHTLVESDNPFVAGADTDPWAIERDYQSQSGPAALRAFIAARKESAAYLRLQPNSIWSRTARHAIFGPTQLVEIVGWILDHDLIHLNQVRKIKARMKDEL